MTNHIYPLPVGPSLTAASLVILYRQYCSICLHHIFLSFPSLWSCIVYHNIQGNIVVGNRELRGNTINILAEENPEQRCKFHTIQAHTLSWEWLNSGGLLSAPNNQSVQSSTQIISQNSLNMEILGNKLSTEWMYWSDCWMHIKASNSIVMKLCLNMKYIKSLLNNWYIKEF